MNETLERLKALTADAQKSAQRVADTFRPPYRPNIIEVEGKVTLGTETRQSKAGNQIDYFTFTIADPTVYAAKEPHLGGPFVGDAIWSDRAISAMGYMSRDLREHLGEDATLADMDGATGHLSDVFVPDPSGRTKKREYINKEGQKVEVEDVVGEWYYQILSISSAATKGASASSAALAFMAGKTEDEFYAGVLPYLQSQGLTDATLQLQIVQRSFVGNALSAGMVKKNTDGVFELT